MQSFFIVISNENSVLHSMTATVPRQSYHDNFIVEMIDTFCARFISGGSAQYLKYCKFTGRHRQSK